jgi:hypothetical protein
MIPIQKHDEENVSQSVTYHTFFPLNVHRMPFRIGGHPFGPNEFGFGMKFIVVEFTIAFEFRIQTLVKR